jgi:cephalosporin-C deacetylase-like acetyl esterase
LFDYDSSIPLEAVSTLAEEHVQGKLHDLSYYLNESSERAQAWLVLPPRSNLFPFVIFLHGGGQDRGAFLAEAYLLADVGIASLLMDLPQARAFPDFAHFERDRDAFVQTITSVRRGLDCLALRSDIDMGRGAIVGVSFGACIGSIVAAVDTRLKRAVLTAGVPRMSEFWRASSHPDIVSIRQQLSPSIMESYVEASKAFDAINYLGCCSNVCLFFQFGSGDEVISEEQVEEFSPYASGENHLKIYDSVSHFEMFLNSEVRHDRLRWLQDQLRGSGAGV